MTPSLSANTQAILLLTEPLIAGREDARAAVLTSSEYRQLARRLRDVGYQPADFIGPNAGDVCSACKTVVESDRLKELLERGFLLSQAVDRWHARAMWVISRADDAYPKRWKNRLGEACPPVLYGCGDVRLLGAGGLAVLGSHDADEEAIGFTDAVGRLAAEASLMIASGGDRGVDEAAMAAAITQGGTACGILADSLEARVVVRANRRPLMEGRLVLVSPYDPATRANVNLALSREKLIYATADLALVVNAAFETGGTWAGAIEHLSKFRWIPLYVRATAGSPSGNQGLLAHGGLAWPEPRCPADLLDLRQTAALVAMSPAEQTSPPPATPEALTPSERLFIEARTLILALLSAPKTASEVAGDLDIPTTLAKAWLDRLVEDGVLGKTRKGPARYQIAAQSSLLAEKGPALPRRPGSGS